MDRRAVHHVADRPQPLDGRLADLDHTEEAAVALGHVIALVLHNA